LRFCATGAKPVGAYSFDVLAPWWQTWWAQAIDVFVSALLLLGMHWSRQRRNRRERERLERAVAGAQRRTGEGK